MPRTSLPEIEKRLEMLAMLPQSLGETATMGDFYALDVEWLHAQNQRLREALKALRQSVMNRRAKLGLSGCICCGYDYCIEGCPLLAANALGSKEESNA